MTGARGTMRGAAPPSEGGSPPALHRGDFWFAQRIAACGIPFGLVPALLALPSREGLGRGTFRTGHIDPKDRCATSRGRLQTGIDRDSHDLAPPCKNAS